jgi:predicted O-methyltransferase YrrM
MNLPFALDPDTFAGLAGSEAELFQATLAGASGLGVEIGCLDGFSSVVILASAPNLHLTSIDPLIPDSMEPSLRGTESRLRSNLSAFSGRWEFIKDYSQNVEWNSQLDFLFIDGDHTYEAVLRDYMKWTSYLKVGGILAIHDSRMHRPGGAKFHVGPSKVANERIYDRPEWTIVGEVFSLTIAKKQ